MPSATREAALAAEESLIHVLWINAGLSCDGDSVATQPSIEEIALGALPGLPKVAVHWPLIDFECGPVGGSAEMKAPEPADTPRGAVASPADEQPADTPSGDSGPASTGPAHYAGTTPGEDASEDTHDRGEGEKAASTGGGA
jgi:hypothetical protein